MPTIAGSLDPPIDNRYSVPAHLVAQTVTIHIGLDDTLRVYHAEQLVAYHTLRRADQGWSTVPEHHADLWSAALQVERRSLQTYAEVLPWN